MRKIMLTTFVLMSLASACAPGDRATPTATIPAPATAPLAPTVTQTAPIARNKFGVHVSGENAARPEIVSAVNELGAAWVRVNWEIGAGTQNVNPFLDAGVNVIITFSYRDAANIDTTYGTLKEWQNAGFPFKSKTIYQQRIRDALTPLLPYLASGRQVWAQAENEVGDAALNPTARFWRGTMEQYLAQLAAFHEAVRAVSPAIPVVSSSFPSEALDLVIDASNPRHENTATRVTKMLAANEYDAVDLHFYGCVGDIPAKAQWIKQRLPAGARWISTENSGPDSRCATTPIAWKQNATRFEQAQAAQVSARLAACADNGGSVCLWFSLLDLKDETDVFNHLGLIDRFSNPPRKKPAFDAFKSFVAR